MLSSLIYLPYFILLWVDVIPILHARKKKLTNVNYLFKGLEQGRGKAKLQPDICLLPKPISIYFPC